MCIVMYVNLEWPCNKSVACPLPSVEDAGVAPTVSSSTPGGHPARRLVEVGIRSVFSVPGDFNRENLPVTCSVGGLNSSDYETNGIAISGAYSENLSVTCSVGGPNTIELPGFSLEYRRFQTVPSVKFIVNHLDDAHKLESEHVNISISCNLAAVQHPTFSGQNVPSSLSASKNKVNTGNNDTMNSKKKIKTGNLCHQNIGGNNNMVDNRHNSGDKNVIGPNTMIVGNPIVGDNSGNKNDDNINSNNSGKESNICNNKAVNIGNVCHQIICCAAGRIEQQHGVRQSCL